ncbi:MAG: hypothetical protein ACXWW7_09935 [Nocardioides sp.]
MQQDSAPRRHLGAIIGTVLAVAVVVAGASALTTADPEPALSPGDTPATTSTADDEPTLDLDLGPVTDPDVLATCLADDFATDLGSVDVLYAVEQRSADGSSPVLLLRNAGGDLRMCDAAGPDHPAQLPVPEASNAEPVAFLANSRMAWECSDTTVQGYTATTWLAVVPGVARVQQRFWVAGTPGAWFSTAASGGYAHLQTWLDGPLAQDVELAVEHRVLDHDGDPVAQSALPSGRQPLSGCTGGDVQIG